jgi:serine/threonine protein kinase
MITIYPQPESFIGKEVDGHRIDAVLGRGGMGIVFKAQNLELSRTVALKIINPALAQDESFLRRFRTEARALAQIHHPNIVNV